MNSPPYIRPSVRPSVTKVHRELALIFCMKLRDCMALWVTESNYLWKLSFWIKWPKTTPKMFSWSFPKRWNITFGCRELIVFYHSAQTACPGKLWFLNYGTKRLLEQSENSYFAFFHIWVIIFGLNWFKMTWNEIINGFLYSTKIACPERVWFLSYVLCSWPVQKCVYGFFGKLRH